MSIVKSFSVGSGDMFYIKHISKNFTIIDCYCDDDHNFARICSEIKAIPLSTDITRFISTHPDEDHIGGLDIFDEKVGITNFYCVKNQATKKTQSPSFNKYCDLRDRPKSCNLKNGLSRKWLNKEDDVRKSSGINCLWPITSNPDFKNALKNAKNGESPNNISPIITYSEEGGASFMWMGDLESEFQEKIKDLISWPKIDILFAPHHGRDSGKVPSYILERLKPRLIVIGEASSENLNYYSKYLTITQNSAGDIEFVCDDNYIHIYVSKENYTINKSIKPTYDVSKKMYCIGKLRVNKS